MGRKGENGKRVRAPIIPFCPSTHGMILPPPLPPGKEKAWARFFSTSGEKRADRSSSQPASFFSRLFFPVAPCCRTKKKSETKTASSCTNFRHQEGMVATRNSSNSGANLALSSSLWSQNFLLLRQKNANLSAMHRVCFHLRF